MLSRIKRFPIIDACIQALILTNLVSIYWLNLSLDKTDLQKLTLSHFVVQVLSIFILTVIGINYYKRKDKKLTAIYTFVLICVFLIFLALRTTDDAVVLSLFMVSLPITSLLVFSIQRWNPQFKKLYVCHIFSFILLILYCLCAMRTNSGAGADGANLITLVIALYLFLGSVFLIQFLFIERKDLFVDKEINPNIRIPTYFFIGIAILFQLLSLYVLIMRFKLFNTLTFDDGIFTQAMYSLTQKGIPITTLERTQTLSHFKVHISPILYLIAPIYKLWPSSITLQFIQFLLTSASVIPLFLILRTILPKYICMFLSALYMVQPGILTSSLYGFHENAFLPLLLMWLIYFIVKNKMAGMIIFSILTLMVKEDATIYVITIMLLSILIKNPATGTLNKKQKWVRIGILLISIIYFACAIFYLNQYGDGAMTTRFKNLTIYNNFGILNLIFLFIQHPIYYGRIIFSPDKILYIFYVFGALAFVPLFIKKSNQLFFFVPLIFENLISDWPYQYRLGYQYHYGSTLLIFFLFILLLFDNIKRPPNKKLTYSPIVAGVCIFSFVISTLITASYLVPRGLKLMQNGSLSQEHFEAVSEKLDRIPKESSVIATSIFTNYLANRETIYDFYYHKKQAASFNMDYAVFTIDFESNTYKELYKEYIKNGYKVFDEYTYQNGRFYILKKEK